MSPLFGASKATDATAAVEGASANGGPQPVTQPTGVIAGVSSLTSARPEVVLAVAFAGGMALAILARRLGR
jgi:hypothetical protein